ncbi:MAG: energy transducer TonB [Betaproteobacteria bacterium]|nr:energy transducer TonB [Betaproteobacteria bacterium]
MRIEPKIDFSYTCARPEYNEQARRAEAQGSTTILFTMDTTGHISEATVVKSSGESREHKMLDRLALEAVRNCKGTPGTLDGVPQRITSRITYVWRISGTQSAFGWVPVPATDSGKLLVYRHPKVKYDFG